MREIATLITGQTVTIAERCYLTTSNGETILYGARLAGSGAFVPAESIWCIG